MRLIHKVLELVRPEGVLSDMVFVGRYSEFKFDNSAILHLEQSARLHGSISGIYFSAENFSSDSAIFIPAGSRLEAHHDGPVRVTKVLLLHPEELGDEHIDFSMVPDVPKNVTSPLISLSVRLIRKVAREHDAVLWPALMASARSALSIAVIRNVAPGATMMHDTSPYGLNFQKKKFISSYIKGRLSEPLLLNDLADAAGMSKWHFSRSFRDTFGISPMQYVLRARVIEAQRLMRSSTMSLAQVSAECGFSDQSHMSKAFRIMTGTTPRRYRRGM